MSDLHAVNVNDLINQQPLGRYQKRIILLGFIVIALDGFDIAIMGFIAPSLRASWGVNHHQLGMVMGAALIGLALGAMLSGPLADKLGRRKIIINSVFFFGLWTLATAGAQNIEQMIALRFLTGLGLGAAMPNMGTLVAEFAPERRRSFIITIIFCGFTFGAALGGLAAAGLIPVWGWHALMLLAGFLPLAFIPLLFTQLPESVRFLAVKGVPASHIQHILQRLYPQLALSARPIMPPALSGGDAREAMRLVFCRAYRLGTLMLWLAYFLGLFLVYLIGSWLPSMVTAVGLTMAQAALVTALYQAGGTVGSLFAGWLMDKINPHWALAAIFTGGGVLLLLIGVAPGHAGIIGGLALLCGFCLNGANTGMNALAARFYPTAARATGAGWMHGVGRLGAIASAFAGAGMLDFGWSFTRVFSLLMLPALVTALAIVAKGLNERYTAGDQTHRQKPFPV